MVTPVPLTSPIEFTFSDDPQWRAAITGIIHSLPGWQTIDIFSRAQISSGKISFSYPGTGYYQPGIWTWTIEATGYPDVTVTVVVI